MPKQTTSGLACPECGTGRNDVVETRSGVGAVYRRRQCFNGHRFTTYESTAEQRADLCGALGRLIQSEKTRYESIAAANPGDSYAGLIVLEDIDLLERAIVLLRTGGSR